MTKKFRGGSRFIITALVTVNIKTGYSSSDLGGISLSSLALGPLVHQPLVLRSIVNTLPTAAAEDQKSWLWQNAGGTGDSPGTGRDEKLHSALTTNAVQEKCHCAKLTICLQN